MIEENIDFWDAVKKHNPTHITCPCCGVIDINDRLAMKSSLGLNFKAIFPGIDSNAAEVLRDGFTEDYHYSDSDYNVITNAYNRRGFEVVLMQDRKHWRDNLNPDIFVESCVWLNTGVDILVNIHGLDPKVVIGRPDCTDDEWVNLKRGIDFLDDNFIVAGLKNE